MRRTGSGREFKRCSGSGVYVVIYRLPPLPPTSPSLDEVMHRELRLRNLRMISCNEFFRCALSCQVFILVGRTMDSSRCSLDLSAMQLEASAGESVRGGRKIVILTTLQTQQWCDNLAGPALLRSLQAYRPSNSRIVASLAILRSWEPCKPSNIAILATLQAQQYCDPDSLPSPAML